MNDMSQVIVPKSDQLNSDDLISGPRTIKITAVEIRPGTEQPVSIRYEGDGGKPWKTCKSMNRVLVTAWGPDAKAYAGRSVTLYRDPSVKWGGLEVGGIRISHMSHIDSALTLALTMTKGSRKPYTVRPLPAEAEATAAKPAPQKQTPESWATEQIALLTTIREASDEEGFDEWLERSGPALAKLKTADFPLWQKVTIAVNDTRETVKVVTA